MGGARVTLAGLTSFSMYESFLLRDHPRSPVVGTRVTGCGHSTCTCEGLFCLPEKEAHRGFSGG